MPVAERDLAPGGEAAGADRARPAVHAHPWGMTDVGTRAPGNLTVPLLSGWETIGGLLAAVVLGGVLVGALVVLARAARTGASGRSEWQAYLAARSAGRPGTTGAGPGEGDPPAASGPTVQ